MSTPPIPALSTLPAAPRRALLHWTGGQGTASAYERTRYHLLVERSGNIVAGVPIAKNMRQITAGDYAAHTAKMNSFSVGFSFCGMMGAVEGGTFGSSPLTEAQVRAGMEYVGRCCRAWGLNPLDRKVLLSHAEVPEVYGIAQPGKWDITVLPWLPSLRGAKAVGDYLRSLAAGAEAPAPRPTIPLPPIPPPPGATITIPRLTAAQLEALRAILTAHGG